MKNLNYIKNIYEHLIEVFQESQENSIKFEEIEKELLICLLKETIEIIDKKG